MQSLSVVFGLIKMAMTVESYLRFETQKHIGRNYPWLSPHQVEARSTVFRRTLSAPGEVAKRDDDDPMKGLSASSKTLNVNNNNFDDKNEKVLKEITFVSNITDDDKLNAANLRVPDKVDRNRPSTSSQNVPDDDLMDNIDEIKAYLRKTSNADLDDSTSNIYVEVDFDRVPSLPPPPRPTSTKHPYLDKLNRLSTFKDMLVFNAENFIKENVPRLPEGMFEHPSKEKEIKQQTSTTPASPTTPTSPTSNEDETDLMLPSRKILVHGIESDDIVAKFISFLGWAMFLLMRMISISVFAVFFPEICGWICLAHYLVMLLCLINETRFKQKWQRTSFYLILAYIYIFNLMEFKVKFKNVRRWCVGYFIFVMLQNIAMTTVWYNFTEFLDSWWFEFMFLVILQSGIMSTMCLVLYFFYLKPQDKNFFVNENEKF